MNKKTYYELLNELSSDDLFEGLLGYGLFAEKIPPFLTSENFLEFCKNPPENFNFDKTPKKYINYESIRNINIPRILSVPNPIAYYHLCKVLSDNWDKLLEYFRNKTEYQEYKISRIHIRKIDDNLKVFTMCYQNLDDIDLEDYSQLIQKHIFEMNHKNFCTDDYPEPKLLIGKKYVVKADISNCFPSIYTHSLAWALVSKEVAKYNRDDSEWFNKIDIYARNLKDGETHGILIGNHSSNILSEIILTAIDEIMYEKGYRYIRNIDDYSCYIDTREKADEFLVDLSTELKQFGLMLNHKKTEILKLPLASTENWVRKLNSFVFSNVSKLKLNEVRAYFDIALDLMIHNKENSAILNYSIKVLSKREMTQNAKDYFIDTIHHLVLLYPYLVTLLDQKIFSTFSIDKSKIESIAKDLFNLGESKKLYETMSYALFFSLKYNFILVESLFEKVEKTNDTILLLLSYLHDKKFVKHSKVMKQYKELAKELNEEIDEYWIFVYEVLTAGLLTKEWKSMKKEEITFLRSEYCL
ncbi:MAG: RNA-directed DNA polymerase [Sulfuricurvum sp.]